MLLSHLRQDGCHQTLFLTGSPVILRGLMLQLSAAITYAVAVSEITARAKRGSRSDAHVVSAIDVLKP
jgi:hypothetical protein